MRWTILTLTQPSRTGFYDRLASVLAPQTACHADIIWLRRYFDPRLSLGENRQALLDVAVSEYVSWIDDDDLVPFDYVDRIYPQLGATDYIGFRVQGYCDGVKSKPTFHSLRHGKWFETEAGYFRDISHLNPLRRSLAMKVRMAGGFGEDARWATELRKLGIVKTERYIDDVMYHYFSRTKKTDGPR